jgi:hypothetical protein
MVLVLKIKFGEDTRRLTVESAPTFDQLVVLLKQLFPNLRSPFSVKYQDEDGDLITITTDLELKESVNVSSVTQSSLGAPVLRLFLTVPEKPPATSIPVEKEEVPETKASETPGQNPFAAFANSPIAQLLNNPSLLQSIAPILSNPQLLQSMIGQFVASMGPGQQQPSVNDLTKLFQSLGLNQTAEKQPTENAQSAGSNWAQLLNNNPFIANFLPQMMAMFSQNNPFAQPTTTVPPSTSNPKEEEDQVHSGCVRRLWWQHSWHSLQVQLLPRL